MKTPEDGDGKASDRRGKISKVGELRREKMVLMKERERAEADGNKSGLSVQQHKKISE